MKRSARQTRDRGARAEIAVLSVQGAGRRLRARVFALARQDGETVLHV